MIYRHEVLWGKSFSEWAYDGDANSIEQGLFGINWRPLDHSELGLPAFKLRADLSVEHFLPNNSGPNFIYESTRVQGVSLPEWITQQRTDNAFSAISNDGLNLAIGFRGTTISNLAEWGNNIRAGLGDWELVADYFQPLVHAALSYALDVGAERVYFFGHSRGGAVAEWFYNHYAPQAIELGIDFRGVSFASPGTKNGSAGYENGFLSFERSGDRVANITPFSENHVTEVTLNTDRGRIDLNHSLENYLADIAFEGLIPPDKLPDLIATDLVLITPTDISPDTMIIDVEWTVLNIGGEMLERSETTLFLSPTPRLGPGAIELVTYQIAYWLPSEVKKYGGEVFLPADLAPGEYHLIAGINLDGSFDELDYDNNITNSFSFTVFDTDPAPLLPDHNAPVISASNVSISAGSLQPGSHISVSYTLENIGDLIASGSVAGVYLSTTPSISTSDRLLASFDHFSIAGGNSLQVSNRSVKLPDDIAPGNYWIGVIGGFDRDLAGTATADSASSGTLLSVDAPPAPPSVDAAIRLRHFNLDDSSVEVGERLYFGFGLENIGTQISTDFHVAFYVTRNQNEFVDPIFFFEEQVQGIDPAWGRVVRDQSAGMTEKTSYLAGIRPVRPYRASAIWGVHAPWRLEHPTTILLLRRHVAGFVSAFDTQGRVGNKKAAQAAASE
ncbi:MAG: hypothetical protein JJU08_12580 [Rhodobacteraceae bacterium]|nr:hypothetical protein [Paracoccaceae bacterium]